MSLLEKAKIFLKLDIYQAYYRIRLATVKDYEYTTFNTAYKTIDTWFFLLGWPLRQPRFNGS